MVHDSRSCRKARDGEASNSNYKPNSGKGSASGSPSNNSSSLRRSTRDVSSKKQSSTSPLSARKSERLEKRIPISPVKRQVKSADKHDTSSPLRRSERGRNSQPSTPSSSRKSDKGSFSPDLKHQGKMEEKSGKSWKNKSSTKLGKLDLKAGGRRRKRLDAFTYRALFKSLKMKVKASDSVKRRRLPENSPSGSCSSEFGGSGKSQDGEEDSAMDNKGKSREVNICLKKDGAVEQRKIPETSLIYSGSSECGGSGNAQDVQEDSAERCTEKSLEVNSSLEKDGAVQGLCSDLKMLTSDSCQNHGGDENFCGSEHERPLQSSGVDASDLPLHCEAQLGKHGELAVRVQIDSCNTGKLQEKELHMRLEQMVDRKSGSQNCEVPREPKGKRNIVQVVTVAPEDVCRKGITISGADASSSELGMNCPVEQLTTCSKRHRVDDTKKKEVSSLSPKSTARLPYDDVSRVQEQETIPSIKLPNVPGANLPDSDSGHLICVNKLWDCWQKGNNGIIIDEQDQVPKIVGLILSLQSSVAKPFLVITPCPRLLFWEAEFVRLAPSINLVVYHGSRYAREITRKLDFSEDGNVMFEALLSSPEVLYEDLEFLRCICWGAVFIDDCQHPDILAHSSNFKKLTTDWRLLIANSRLKDSVAEYHNILSLLYSGSNSCNGDDLTADSNHNLSLLKERLLPFVVYGHKSDAPRFLEFWVPVQISNLQLEQYCSSLLSSSTALRSCTKSDPVGALRNTLIATRKCCDHPYLVNNSLQSSLTSGRPLDILDIGVKASGKLQLLDAILFEIKKHGLRVLILFQSIGGSGRDSIGDILDDVLHQRFGQDSYERIDGGGCIPSKKQAALNKFNKEKGRFIFLLETRACLPSIKLTSVDVVIIFDSDWNPLNDLRALQRISIDSGFEQIYVLRLYSSCTIEEKVLMLAKKDVILDSTLQCISPSTSQMLLMWGASYLFTKLDEFHQDDNTDHVANIAPANSLFKNVLQELCLLIERQTIATKFITKAQTLLPNGGNYIESTLLLGEQQIKPLDEGLPHVFWTNLLDGRHPRWKYLSVSSQRNRKRVQYFEESPRKKKKADHPNLYSSSLKVGADEEAISVNEGDSGVLPKSNSEMIGKMNSYFNHHFGENKSDISLTLRKDNSDIPEVPVAGSKEKRKSRDGQRRLYQFLKPKISQLCEILQLPEEVSNVAERFLEYVIDNHRVSQEPESILQAFQICVCWSAASLLDHKIDHKESLELAKSHLKFSCEENEADFLFLKMHFPRKQFSRCSEEFKERKYHKDHSLEANGHTRERTDGNNMVAAVMAEGGSPVLKSVGKQALPPIEVAEAAKREISRIIRKAVKKSEKQMEKLKKKQHNEIEEFNMNWEEKKSRLMKEHSVESTVTSSVHSSIPIRMEKLKVLDSEFEKKLQELDRDMAISLKALEARHQDEKAEEELKAARFLEEVRSWGQDFDDRGDLLLAVEQIREHEGSNGSISTSGKLQEDQNMNRAVKLGPLGHEGTSSPVARASEKETCATDKVRYNTSNDTSASIQVEQLPKTSSKAMDGDASYGPATLICTTDESISCRSVEMVPPVSLSSPKESLGGMNNSQVPDPLVESDGYSNHINALASDRNICHVACQNSGASHFVTREPVDGQPSPVDSHMVTMAGQGDLLLVIEGHGNGTCGPHGKEMQDPSERGADKTSSMPPAEASSSDHTEAHDEAEGSFPVTEFTVSASLSPTPLGHEQSVLPLTENQLFLEPGDGNQDCADILIRGSSQPYIENPVPANGPNLVQYEMNSATRGRPTSFDCSHPPTSVVAPVVSHNSLHLSSDPLHNELERLRKESDEALRLHDEMIRGLKSDREKEIEEMAAQIRRKYETKIQEADAVYALKKQQLDINHNRVLMNKILAEALRSKCSNYRPPSGARHDSPSRRMRQVSQSQQAPSRSSAIDNATSSGLPVVCPQITEPLNTTNTSSAIFSSIPNRPPQICSTMPAPSNRQLGSDLRGPAPHLQYFRPPTFPSSGNLSFPNCGALNLQSSSSPSATSPYAPTLVARPQQAVALPTYLSGSRGWSHQPESVWSPVYQSSSLSAMELLVGVSTQSGAALESTLPLPDLTQNPSDFSEFGTSPNSSDQAVAPANVVSSHQGTAGDVVCLSDDD